VKDRVTDTRRHGFSCPHAQVDHAQVDAQVDPSPPSSRMSKRSSSTLNAPPAADSAKATKRMRAASTSVDGSSIPAGNLIFAVPKKGRLYKRVLELLEGIGIAFRRKERLDIAHSKNMPVTLVFLNAKDVAVFVGSGSVDLGITGEDIIAESGANVDVQLQLQMGKCKLCLQAPRHLCSKPPSFFAGQRVVTSFPNLTRQYFDKLDSENGTTTPVQFVSGSVEAACGLGLADAVVDLVETGTTMRAAGLDVVADVMPTQTVLVSNPDTNYVELIQQIVARVQGWLTATHYNMVVYNIERSKIAEASKITPGVRAPTIIDLVESGWVAMQALVPVKEVPAVMEQLAAIGGSGIIATEITNCRI
jgi:ATP phosphoribosyltransferase